MCWDKETCWDHDAGVPKYLNRDDPPCKSQTMFVTPFSMKGLNRCKDHQFFTIVDNAVQERDLKLYLEITPPFSNWTSYCTYNGLWQTTCLYNPEIVINGYKSIHTNFEWRHFDGTKLDYLGTWFHGTPWNETYSTFTTKLPAKLSSEC